MFIEFCWHFGCCYTSTPNLHSNMDRLQTTNTQAGIEMSETKNGSFLQDTVVLAFRQAWNAPGRVDPTAGGWAQDPTDSSTEPQSWEAWYRYPDENVGIETRDPKASTKSNRLPEINHFQQLLRLHSSPIGRTTSVLYWTHETKIVNFIVAVRSMSLHLCVSWQSRWWNVSFVSPNLSWLPHSPSDALRAKIQLNTATRSRKVWPRKDRRLLCFSRRQFLKRVQSLETWDLGSGQNRTIKQKQTQNLSKNMYHMTACTR